ncbi:MAG TPA: hypothetical protein VKM55_22875, partial [Candidatus Lokiarchaeia archaeon]|nr:hypothetical protein [Candidatus Lokiarchaeia archaeon]
MAKKDNDVIGIFLGMQGSSYEYIANIIAPYQQTRTIIIGDIILIDNINEDIVARIMDVVPRGEFMTFSGEKWLSD